MVLLTQSRLYCLQPRNLSYQLSALILIATQRDQGTSLGLRPLWSAFSSIRTAGKEPYYN